MSSSQHATIFSSGLIIYNLFPRLVGPVDRWYSHIDRAHAMRFNAIYINPFHYPGFSGSLYAPKNYYEFNPLFMDRKKGADQLKQLCAYVHDKGSLMIMDLVINHTAIDADIVSEHPSWFKRKKDGTVQNPSAIDPADARRVTVWGDLAEIDNENAPDREALWAYWKELITFYLDVGFDGFRCDAAYQVPVVLWEELIPHARKKKNDCLFIAETLGCQEEDIVNLSRLGFDYIYNSFKWWDFKEEWFMRQYDMSMRHAASISFPETHDTERLYAECGGDVRIMKMRYLSAALLTKGVLMPVGYEFGFRKRLNVVHTQMQDWEDPNIDLSDFITRVNEIKLAHNVFNEDNILKILPVDDTAVFVLLKMSKDRKERALIMLNTDAAASHTIAFDDIFDRMGIPESCRLADLSIEQALPQISKRFQCSLSPYQIKIIFGKTLG